jgi:rSAM/selenodomain-associated transferase 1
MKVLIMARAPRAGAVKTRLQPLLGARGCADLQAALIRHTVARARPVAPTYLALDGDCATCGGVSAPDVAQFDQHGADLGARMRNAVARVGGPVIVIGTDVPTLTAEHLCAAADMLADHDVVFGPALDGGYYLVALREPHPQLFAIDPALWGGPDVLRASVAAATTAGLRVGLLKPLRDLDTPEDARALLADGGLPAEIAARLAPVSIVVPTLNEADRIQAARCAGCTATFRVASWWSSTAAAATAHPN